MSGCLGEDWQPQVARPKMAALGRTNYKKASSSIPERRARGVRKGRGPALLALPGDARLSEHPAGSARPRKTWPPRWSWTRVHSCPRWDWAHGRWVFSPRRRGLAASLLPARPSGEPSETDAHAAALKGCVARTGSYYPNDFCLLLLRQVCFGGPFFGGVGTNRG